MGRSEGKLPKFSTDANRQAGNGLANALATEKDVLKAMSWNNLLKKTDMLSMLFSPLDLLFHQTQGLNLVLQETVQLEKTE